MQHGPDGVDDAHQAGADGTEDALDLVMKSVSGRMMVSGKDETYTRDDGAHFEDIRREGD